MNLKKYNKPALLVIEIDAKAVLVDVSVKNYQTGGHQSAGGDEEE